MLFSLAMTRHLSHHTENCYRPPRVCQIRGSTDEGTGAYTMTYARIAEEGVRSPLGSRAKSRDRCRAIGGRYLFTR